MAVIRTDGERTEDGFVVPTYGSQYGDYVYGSSYNDLLNGLAGNDSIAASWGNDTLIGGLGRDTLAGGEGADRFVYNSTAEMMRDVITDFTTGEDVLDLRAITQGDAWFIHQAEFSGNGGQAEVRYETAYVGRQLVSYVQVDMDADGISDQQVQLNNVYSLYASDVVI